MVRRRIGLRPEGWYYIAVLSFVLGGAVLRDINLLVMLAGLMAAPLLVHWFMLRGTLAGLTVERSLPTRICAGDVMETTVSITNRKRRGTAWGIEFHDSFQSEQNASGEAKLAMVIHFPRIAAGRTVQRRYYTRLTQRGKYRYQRASVRSHFPLGLIEGVCAVDMPDEFFVCPRLGKLTSRWNALIDADEEGQMQSRHRRGLLEGEFYALRDWRNGDSRRWIHWRTSAKMGTLAVRQFEQHRSCHAAILLDAYLPPAAAERSQALLEWAACFTATATVEMCRRGGSQLTVLLAGKEWTQRAGSASNLLSCEVLDQLAVVRGSAAPDITRGGIALKEAAVMGARCIVISTRARSDLPSIDLPEGTIWLNAAGGDFERYFLLEEVSHP